MKRSFLLLIVALIFVWVVSAIAEPVAPLATLSATGKLIFAAEGKTEADMKKNIPPKELVSIPAYPGSLFVLAEGDENELTMVQLISKDSPEKVIAWYKKQLGKEWQNVPDLATKQLGDVGVFVKTDKKNISALDALNYKQLSVSKVEKPGDTGFIDAFSLIAVIFDVRGIKSWIVMTVKPAI